MYLLKKLAKASTRSGLVGNKKYAESFTAGHTGGLTRGFVETYNVMNKGSVYTVEIWNADLFGIPTGTAPLATTVVYNPASGYAFAYPVFSSPARVRAGSNYAMVVTVEETAYNGVTVSPGNICAGTFSLNQNGTGAFTADASSRDLTFAVFIDATPPTVSNVRATRTSGAGLARRNTNFEITFTDDMKPTTIDTDTIKLYRLHSDGSKSQVRNGTTVSCVADSTAGTQCMTAVLDPYGSSATRLSADSRYQVIVNRGAKDVAGNALKKSFSRTFTTGSA
ncbi:MAG TPA: Ig-like domain-containing protein [Rubrobacter sp.]|nr:Ig-like domain-containing protein [Rubrobacter sp.]